MGQLFGIVTDGGEVLGFFPKLQEAERALKRGIYCDGYDGIGPIYVNIPPGSKVLDVSERYSKYYRFHKVLRA